MMFWIFRKVADKQWVVMDKQCLTVAIFDEDELYLLNKFVRVPGVYKDDIEPSIIRRTNDHDTQWNGGILRSKYAWRREADGYIIYHDKRISICSPFPRLLYKSVAVVTDDGHLVALGSAGSPKIVLGNICSRIMRASIHDDKTVYVLDDRIDYIDTDCCMHMSAGFYFDISALTNKVVLEQFRAFQSNMASRSIPVKVVCAEED